MANTTYSTYKLDEPNRSFLVEHLSVANVVITIALSLAISTVLSFTRAPKYPESIPWAGHGKGWVAALKNSLGSFTNSTKWVQEGYEEYSKKDKTFVVPGGIGSKPEIIIPRSQMQWMVDQPDHVLSTSAAHYELLGGEYTFIKPLILKDAYHEHIIHKCLARNLNALIPDLNDEIERDVDEMFGMKEQWTSFNLFNTFLAIIPKITNRMVVGEPLCRNTDFLKNMSGFTNDVILGMMVLPLTPRMLHPVVGSMLGLPSKYHWWRTSKLSLPLIEKRLEDMKRKDSGDPEYKDWKEPNDFITWTIRTAQAEGRADEFDAIRISQRIMPINFASIHTTSLTGHGVLLDILASEPSVLEGLREEATRIYKEEGNEWTKTGLARMHRMDSAIRESQRFSTFAQTIVHRQVLAKEGITTPDGVYCAYGTFLSCPLKGASFDKELVAGDVTKYDAFRFSRDREAYEARVAEERDSAEALKMRQTGLVATSVKHFPFGHGRHACPGRFFVSHELKILFAYIIMNYDIKNLNERPKSTWIGRTFVPATQACIEVKRRAKV